jgi:hypothetical protein
MRKKILFTITLVCAGIFGITHVQAQSKSQGFLKSWAAGVELGTYGPGITIATSLTPHIKLRGAIDYFSITADASLLGDFEADGSLVSNTQRTIPLTGSFYDPQLKFSNFKAILDFYPMRNGIFSFSAGVYLGSSAFSLSAKIDDYQSMVNQAGGDIVFEYEDLIIKPNKDGSFDGKLNFGNKVKPYFGIGLGRTIANSRVGFKFDLGLIYQGEYKFTSSNESVASMVNGSANGILDDIDISASILKMWPIINFSLSYRFY